MSEQAFVYVVEMVAQWLQAHDYDGLWNDDYECGCILGDLMPCGEVFSLGCAAGYIGQPGENGDADGHWWVWGHKRPERDEFRRRFLHVGEAKQP